MNTEQFITLTEAYGADINHWPTAYQKPAAEVIALNLPEIKHALEQAAILDAIFDSSAPFANPSLNADRALFDRIVATAPRQKISIWHAWITWSWVRWYGLAGAGLAGAVAGAFFVSIWMSGMLPESTETSGALSGVIAEYVYDGQDLT
jgi:hypothetical protein